PHDRQDQGGDKKDPGKGGRLLKDQDAHQDRSHGPDAGPYGIRRSNGQALGGPDQQQHTDGKGEKETPVPEVHFGSSGLLGLSQAEGKGHFEEAGDDQDDPVQFSKKFYVNIILLGIPWGRRSLSMGLQPVFPGAHFNLQGHGQGIGPFHFGFDELLHSFQFFPVAIKYQFIVYLQKHFGSEIPFFQFFVDVDHGDLDDVRGTALYGGVHGIAFRGPTHDLVTGIDVLEVAPAPQYGLHITVLPGELDLLTDIIAKLGIGFVIGVDEFLGLGPSQVCLVAQAKGRYPVDDPKIDGLGMAALFPADFFQGNVEDLGGGGGMDVLPPFEGLDHGVLLAQGRNDPEFDLGIIRGQQQMVPVPWDKGL